MSSGHNNKNTRVRNIEDSFSKVENGKPGIIEINLQQHCLPVMQVTKQVYALLSLVKMKRKFAQINKQYPNENIHS